MTSSSSSSSPVKGLRELLMGDSTELMLGVHDAISAVVAAGCGVRSLWVGSLALSCARGVADCGDLTSTEVLDVVERITDRVSTPVLVDGDASDRSPRATARLVRGLCLRNAAGVCLEDKAGPKRNSFSTPGSEYLAPVDLYLERLRAALSSRTNSAFVVVARTEALVVGAEIDEALDRAYAYVDAGADAIFVHSKAASFDEIREFCVRWDMRAPLMCAPTSYAATPFRSFRTSNISLVLWANQMMRRAILAMGEVAARASNYCDLPSLEGSLVSIDELLRLTGDPSTAPDRVDISNTDGMVRQ